jgi:amidase
VLCSAEFSHANPRTRANRPLSRRLCHGSAAALYYDDIDITIGGDQGGSLRIPASECRVVGWKPTHSLVPYTGMRGIDQTFDHIGPMPRRVAEVAQTLEVMAGKDPLDSRQYDVPMQSYTATPGRALRGVRIGLLQEGFGQEGAEPDVDAAVRCAIAPLGTLGATITEVSIPAHLTAGCIAWALFAGGMTALLRSNGMGDHWRGAYNPALADVAWRLQCHVHDDRRASWRFFSVT